MGRNLLSLLFLLAVVSGCSDESCQSDPTTEFNMAIETLVKEKDDSRYLRLIENGLDVNYQNSCGASMLHISTIVGDESLVTLLLSKSANPNAVAGELAYSPLMIAVLNEHLSTVEILVKHGADPDYTNDAGVSAISIARENGYRKLLAVLETKVP